MPFYEYECSSCKFYTEVMQKITDSPLTKCPSCGKNALKKLVSAPIFRLKGGGWYETDFKGDKEGRRNLAGSEAEESSKTEPATDASKAEAPKTEPSKPEVASSEGSAKAAKSAGGSRSAAAGKASPGKRGRTAKAPSRVAAAKARPAPAARSKAKPAGGRKKKARK